MLEAGTWIQHEAEPGLSMDHSFLPPALPQFGVNLSKEVPRPGLGRI